MVQLRQIAEKMVNVNSKDPETCLTNEAAVTTLVQSPVTAVCVSCHDSTVAWNHMILNDGTFYITRIAAWNKKEQCLICHSPGKVAAIKDVHSR